MIRVYMRHIWAARLCSRGARVLADRYNLDYTKFLQEGIEVEKLEALDNALINQACIVARAEYAKLKSDT